MLFIYYFLSMHPVSIANACVTENGTIPCIIGNFCGYPQIFTAKVQFFLIYANILEQKMH